MLSFKDVKQEVLNSIEWDRWFNEPGMPIVQNKFDRSLAEQYESLASKWKEDGGATATENDIKGWDPKQIRILFFFFSYCL